MNMGVFYVSMNNGKREMTGLVKSLKMIPGCTIIWKKSKKSQGRDL